MSFLIYTLAIIGGGLVVSASMITIYYLIEKIIEAFKGKKNEPVRGEENVKVR